MQKATFEMIAQWGKDRQIIGNGKVSGQMRKLGEEFGELSEALLMGDDTYAKDSIGDIMVVLTMIAGIKGWDIQGCLDQAYDEIKDRKGYLNANGVFVKQVQ